MPNHRKFNTVQEDEVIREYAGGRSAYAIARDRGCWTNTVTDVLRRRGIPVRLAAVVCRKWRLDEGIFDDVCTEEVAYAIGFIAADGSVKRNCVEVALQRGDRAHLEKLKHALGAEVPVYDYMAKKDGKEFPSSRINLCSVRLVRALTGLGIGPRKAHTVVPWAGPRKLMRHFYRGLFDGDGTISLAKRACAAWRVQVVGSKPMMEGFARFIAEETGFLRPVRPHRNSWYVWWTRLEHTKAVVRLLYESAAIALARKQHLAGVVLARQRKIAERRIL